jgi:hypothetical protein
LSVKEFSGRDPARPGAGGQGGYPTPGRPGPTPSAAGHGNGPPGQFNVNDVRQKFAYYLRILKALKEHKSLSPAKRKLRYEIVVAALNGTIGFDFNHDPNAEHWEVNKDGRFVLRPGHAAAGLEDRIYNNGGPTGCERASQMLILEGLSRLAQRQGQGERFDREFSGKALADLFPEARSNGLQRFTDHPADLNAPQFLPGDRL